MTMTARESIEAAVQKGAEFLDEVYPDWDDYIYLKTLDLANPDACVLGQLYRDGYWGVVDIFWPESPVSESSRYGFNSYDTPGGIKFLTQVWTELIKKRREAKGLVSI